MTSVKSQQSEATVVTTQKNETTSVDTVKNEETDTDSINSKVEKAMKLVEHLREAKEAEEKEVIL